MVVAEGISGIGLVIAPAIDMHAYAVQHAAKSIGQTILIVDTADFTQSFDLVARWNGERRNGKLLLKGGQTVELSQLSGLWWRRPRYPAVSSSVNAAFADVAARESRAALWGALNAMVPRSFNSIGSSRIANQKPVQLSAASEVGLKTPDTLVTNDARAVSDFYEAHNGKIIYKIFRGPDMGFYPTRKLTPEDLLDLNALKNCPCIFQEFIPGLYDLRVSVVGDQVFAAKIEFDRNSSSIDSRLCATNCTRYELPNGIADKILKLTARFGLIYGAMDLRRSEQGDYVFFELNPEGQYLWTEIEAELPISRAIATYLTMRS